MSVRFAGSRTRCRPVILSSDNDTSWLDELPPSDPPEEQSEDEELPATTDENPFLTSESTCLDQYILSSDDMPLDQLAFPTSEDIPLASRKSTTNWAIARQRAITGIRLGHEVGFGVSTTRSPGSLAYHNTCLRRIPIVLTSLPPFRVCRDLIMVSLYARILHCSWSKLEEDATEILQQFANADRVQELREPRLEAQKLAEAEEKATKKK